jgi:putative oxidoreductase
MVFAREGSVMRVATLLARVLLGGLFVVLGLNFFLHFLAMPAPEPDSAPARFFGVMGTSGWMHVVSVCQIVGGLLVLSGVLTPLGLVVLGPVIVNIQLYHLFIDHQFVPLAVGVLILEIFLIYRYWPHFAPVFDTNTRQVS